MNTFRDMNTIQETFDLRVHMATMNDAQKGKRLNRLSSAHNALQGLRKEFSYVHWNILCSRLHEELEAFSAVACPFAIPKLFFEDLEMTRSEFDAWKSKAR